MNDILNLIASVVVLILMGGLTAFLVVLNLFYEKEFKEIVYGRYNK